MQISGHNDGIGIVNPWARYAFSIFVRHTRKSVNDPYVLTSQCYPYVYVSEVATLGLWRTFLGQGELLLRAPSGDRQDVLELSGEHRWYGPPSLSPTACIPSGWGRNLARRRRWMPSGAKLTQFRISSLIKLGLQGVWWAPSVLELACAGTAFPIVLRAPVQRPSGLLCLPTGYLRRQNIYEKVHIISLGISNSNTHTG